MKKKVRLAVVIVVVLVFANFLFVTPSKTMVPDKIKATWLWHTEQIQQQPDQILAFLTSKKTSVLYLQINRDIPSSDYEAFIRKASAQGISVHALDGSSSWLSNTKGKVKRASFYKWLETYQGTVAKEARFTGIHLDVEPYVRDSWETDYASTVAAYQTVLLEGKQIASRLDMIYGLDIPFWFDERQYDNAFGKGILSEWLINTADHVTIMAYRNKAKGPNGILDLAKQELLYADNVNKQVLIGIETLPSSEGDFLTFYGKKESDMNQELVTIEAELTDSKSFAGSAIHSIDGWMQLK